MACARCVVGWLDAQREVFSCGVSRMSVRRVSGACKLLVFACKRNFFCNFTCRCQQWSGHDHGKKYPALAKYSCLRVKQSVLQLYVE